MAETDSTPSAQDTTDQDNVGYAPPDTGLGEAAESEVPVGVDALVASDIPTGDEVTAVADDGDEGAAADEAGEDAPSKTDAEAQVGADT
jgi:hypothetical protein